MNAIKKVCKPFIMLGLALTLALTTIGVQKAEASNGTWQLDGWGWWYRHYDGSYPWSSWEYINGAWYSFDYWGYAECNCWSWHGVWYGFNADCSMTRGWTQGWDGTWYYCTPYEGTSVGTSGWYYPEGCMVWSDWAWINGKCYYFNADGSMAHDTWVGDYHVSGNGDWDYGGGIPTPDPYKPAEPSEPYDPYKPAPYNPNDPVLVDAIAYLNEIRAQHGLQPVKLDPAAQTLAEIKSNDMAVNGYCSHYMEHWGSGKHLLADILERGYISKKYPLGGANINECIAGGRSSYKETIDDWIASPYHRDALLSPDMIYVGLAVNTVPSVDKWEYKYTYECYNGFSSGAMQPFDGPIPFTDDFPKTAEWYIEHENTR